DELGTGAAAWVLHHLVVDSDCALRSIRGVFMAVRTVRSRVGRQNHATMRPRETPSVSWLTLLATTLGAAFTPARWSDWAPALPHGSSGAQIPVVKGEPLANAPRSPTRFGLPLATAS